MNETIYNLLPRDAYVEEKKPMYRSQHDPLKPLTGSTFGCTGSSRPLGNGSIQKKDGASFGPPAPALGLPTTKKSKSMRKSFDENVGTSHRKMVRKPPIPAKEEKPVMGITTTKNFVTSNAVEAILQVPKSLDSKELNYMKKEDFGKVPAYLSTVKEEIKRENEMIDRYIKQQMGEVERPPDFYEELSETERSELIAALKEKWDNVNANYQKITHLVRLDTTGHIRRKETLEAELQQLEKDIERLQRASNVLIRK